MAILLRKRFPGTSVGVGEEIRRRLQNAAAETFLYVVPTKRKLRELQRSFLLGSPGNVSPAFNLFTFETLAAKFHSFLLPQKRLVTGPVQAVLLLEALRSVSQELSYLRLRGRNRSLPQGTFEKIVRVLNHLKERGVYLPVLYDEAAHADIGERSRLADILKISEAYEKLLGDRFIDPPGILKEVNEQWAERDGGRRFAEAFPRCDAIFISGFDEFSDPELTMLHNCSEVKGIGTLLAFDFHPRNGEVFGHLRENFEKLLTMGFTDESLVEAGESDFQSYVARTLFLKRPDETRFPTNGGITISRCADRAGEVEFVARSIKRLVEERPGRDLSAICVSMVRPQLYTQLFREVFATYGIPANITDRYSLSQAPVVVAIMSLLVLPERQYQLAGVMRALSSPYLRIESGGRRIDSGNIYAVASLLKITGNRADWNRRIDERRASLEERARSADDEHEVSAIRRELDMLAKAQDDLRALFALLKRFASPMNPVEFKRELLDLLSELRLVESILADSTERVEELEVVTRAYQKFIDFIDDFLEILTIEGHGAVKHPLSFYTDRLRQTISQVRFNIRQRYGYGVNVTSFDETRGLNFGVMFMVGLLDGEFPPVYQPEFFFSSARRERRERYHLHEQRYLFYQAITNFSDRLFLTYPVTVDEKETVPSSFLESLRESVEIEETDHRAGDRIYAMEELHEIAGRHIAAQEAGAPVDDDEERVRAALGRMFDVLRHGMRVERSRNDGPSMPEFNGVIGESLPPDVRGVLEGLRNRIYSVTQLETYGKCPFQYFASRVLRLKVIEEPEEGISPIERGDLLHDILFEFYIGRRARGAAALRDAQDEEFTSAAEELTAIAKKKLDELHVADIFRDLDGEMVLGSPKRRGVLRGFLEHERHRDTKAVPRFFEASFGARADASRRTDPEFPGSGEVQAGNVSLRGKIDRIEEAGDLFTVLDYKSGTHVGKKEIDLGISLQLPLYLYAVEQILTKRRGSPVRPAAGSYYLLMPEVKEKLGIGSAAHNGEAFPHVSKSRQLVASDEELDGVIRTAVAFVNDYVDTIAKGSFPVEPKDLRNVCTHCDFQTTCRIQLRTPIDDKRSGETVENS